jgi:hypothetical protein
VYRILKYVSYVDAREPFSESKTRGARKQVSRCNVNIYQVHENIYKVKGNIYQMHGVPGAM